jgi:hypothetical protein
MLTVLPPVDRKNLPTYLSAIKSAKRHLYSLPMNLLLARDCLGSLLHGCLCGWFIPRTCRYPKMNTARPKMHTARPHLLLWLQNRPQHRFVLPWLGLASWLEGWQWVVCGHILAYLAQNTAISVRCTHMCTRCTHTLQKEKLFKIDK